MAFIDSSHRLRCRILLIKPVVTNNPDRRGLWTLECNRYRTNNHHRCNRLQTNTRSTCNNRNDTDYRRCIDHQFIFKNDSTLNRANIYPIKEIATDNVLKSEKIKSPVFTQKIEFRQELFISLQSNIAQPTIPVNESYLLSFPLWKSPSQTDDRRPEPERL